MRGKFSEKGVPGDFFGTIGRFARIFGYNVTMTINRLKWLRLKKGLSQKELASMLGVSQNKISQLERGTLKIGIEKLYKLAEAVGYESYPRELLDQINVEETDNDS